MKILVSAALAVLSASSAVAHNSLVPHVHPHDASALPDMLALAAAAILVGAGFVMFRRMRKG